MAHLVLSGLLGLGFFALPIRIDGRWTVAFDVAVRGLREGWPGLVGAWCVLLLGVGALGTLLAARGDARWKAFATGRWLAAARVAGLVLGLVFFSGAGPGWLMAKPVGGLMWGILAASVAIIIPVGAMVLEGMVSYGMIELVGGPMRPLMRPLFRLPGRAALDDLLSWIGSYSVGLYMTRTLVEQGRYTRREAFLIVTGFSTVSVGFVGVVCSTLDLLHLFPLVFGSYFLLVYVLAALQARTWPASGISDEVLEGVVHHPEDPERSSVELAMARATSAPGVGQVAARGLREGTLLAASILGTILSVGTAATLLAEYTPVFDWLGAPVVPVLSALGLPDAEMLGPAVIAGITEMYIPALLVREASVEGRFFIAVLSISQLVFFSSVGPMMLEMFRDLPVRLGHLLALFLLRTALLIPMIAGLMSLYSALGWL